MHFTQKSRDIWDLSADRKTLIITTSIGSASREDANYLATGSISAPEGKTYKKVFRKIN